MMESASVHERVFECAREGGLAVHVREEQP